MRPSRRASTRSSARTPRRALRPARRRARDAPGPASPGGADDDDAALQAALLGALAGEEERQIAEAIRLSALEAAPEEVLDGRRGDGGGG